MSKVAEFAVSAGSAYIVFGDSDLLRLVEYAGIRIVAVAQFLDIISDVSG